jgi:hypothetical protein
MEQSQAAMEQSQAAMEQSLSQTAEDFSKTIQARELEIDRRVAAAAEEKRKRLIEKTLVRLIGEMQNRSLADSMLSWHWHVAHKVRTRIVGEKAQVVVAKTVIRSAFSPWLLAARNAEVSRRVVMMEEKLNAKSESAAGLAKEELQAQVAELDARVAAEKLNMRRHAIQKDVVRRMINVKHGLITHAFEGWRDYGAWRRRLINLQQKAVNVLEHQAEAAAFRPWLAAARRHKIEQHAQAALLMQQELAALKAFQASGLADHHAELAALRAEQQAELERQEGKPQRTEAEVVRLARGYGVLGYEGIREFNLQQVGGERRAAVI